MESTDLTVRILQDIREDMRGMRTDVRELRDELRLSREEAAARFQVIESTLRDLAEQLLLLSRGIKVALEQKAASEEQLDDHERRIAALERRSG